GVLAAWLSAHPPATSGLADRVLALFERLNARLRADVGAHVQIGHSCFMVPHLDEGRLRLIWQHHVRPLLEEHFTGQPQRLAGYEIDTLGEPGASATGGRSSGTRRVSTPATI